VLKRACVAALLLVLLPIASATVFIQSFQCNVTVEPRLFTWVGHEVNASVASTLKDMGFTDVMVRYVSNDELNRSRQILDEYDLRYWQHVNAWLGYARGINNVVPFNEQQKSITDPSVVDDCHALIPGLYGGKEAEEWVNMLDGLRGDSQVILTFFADNASMEMFRNFDFTDINVDLYATPDGYDVEYLREVKERVGSLGLYLWVWAGHGWTWQNLGFDEAKHVYGLAAEVGVDRLQVWLAHEYDDVEAGMYESSFLNYPEWIERITTLNREFVVESVR
jgi:hypothetical protein